MTKFKIMSKATAIAPANIAFIKYWGKENEELRYPLNSSISMNLNNCVTTTTVEFSDKFKSDTFFLIENNTTPRNKTHVHKIARNENKNEADRVIRQIDRIRKLADKSWFAKVASYNNFPKNAGIASSASGFAALTLAGCRAAGLSLSEKELSVLARIGSGSACRSIPSGFVEWMKKEGSNDSYAYSLFPPSHWALCDVVVLLQDAAKKTGSSKGMENVFTSPFAKVRLQTISAKIQTVKEALRKKNITLLGEAVEEEAISMHAVMMTQKPPLFYWLGQTLEFIQKVREWRQEGLPVYFTIDAGPNVHLIFEEKHLKQIVDKINGFDKNLKFIINNPDAGARLINTHLF
jgi:diphosphomevalonate decarboxylase